MFRASNNNGSSFGPVMKLNSLINGDASNAAIAAAGNNVYVVWQGNVSITPETDHVYFRASTNNGVNFNTVIDLTTNISNHIGAFAPQVAAAGNSNVTVVWHEVTSSHNNPDNIYAKMSSNNGANLATVAATFLSSKANHFFGYPQISEVGRYVYVAWADDSLMANVPKTFFSSSSMWGASFATAFNIGGTVSNDNNYYQAITASGNNVYVTWTNDSLSCPISCDNTMFRGSPSNGASLSSFGPILNLYQGNMITDLNPVVAATGKSVYVVWSNATGAGPQILYRVSSTNGANFGAITSLTIGASAPPQQTIAASGANVYVGWAGGTPSDSMFFAGNNTVTTFGSAQNLSPNTGSALLPSPVIAVSGPNVYVAWQDDTRGNGDIFFRGNGALPAPDVAITAMNVSKTFAYSGAPANNVTVSVTTLNPGNVAASFVVSVKANLTMFIATNQTVTSLAPGAGQVLSFSWKTSTLTIGKWNLTAYATGAEGETNLSNNILACPTAATGCAWAGFFISRLKGDVSKDCKVDIVDLATVGSTFGKTIGQLGFNAAADLNNDGTINIVDLVLVASSFGQQVPNSPPCIY